jgi:hypothetical protein
MGAKVCTPKRPEPNTYEIEYETRLNTLLNTMRASAPAECSFERDSRDNAQRNRSIPDRQRPSHSRHATFAQIALRD